MALSDAWLKAHSGKERAAVLEATDRDGLSARVSAKGKVIFQLRYRYDGTPCRLDLGTYPAYTLKTARAETQRLRGELEQGHNPKIVRALEKQSLTADSIESLFLQWYESYCKGNKKGHHDVLRSFELHVFPKIGTLPAEKVSLHEWLALLGKHAKERPGIVGHQAPAHCHQPAARYQCEGRPPDQ